MSTSFRSRIVGRDAFIQEAWDKLSLKSLYMNDLRRIGKTEILRKMDAEAPEGWLTSFSDLEGTHTAEQFATLVYKDSSGVLAKRTRVLRAMSAWLEKGAGTEIGGVLKLPDGRPIPWKEALRTTFDDVAEALRGLETPHRMVFFWDEVPYLLDNIANRQGRATAEEVLDILREHLKFLCMDHYLVRNERNEYRFYLELIRRWWRTHRSL